MLKYPNARKCDQGEMKIKYFVIIFIFGSIVFIRMMINGNQNKDYCIPENKKIAGRCVQGKIIVAFNDDITIDIAETTLQKYNLAIPEKKKQHWNRPYLQVWDLEDIDKNLINRDSPGTISFQNSSAFQQIKNRWLARLSSNIIHDIELLPVGYTDSYKLKAILNFNNGTSLQEIEEYLKSRSLDDNIKLDISDAVIKDSNRIYLSVPNNEESKYVNILVNDPNIMDVKLWIYEPPKLL